MNISRLFQWVDFWHIKKSIGKSISPGHLYGYYSDLSSKTQVYNGPKSQEGVPLWHEKNHFYLHPVTVCQVALGYYDRWLIEKKDFLINQFFILSNWLIINQESPFGIWKVDYPVDLFNVDKNWISALVQGQAISVLVRAYKNSGQQQFLNSARQAIIPFFNKVEDGGLQSNDSKNGYVIFEEYPTKLPSKVLNGFISSLWGLYDYLLCDPDPAVSMLYSNGLQTLMKILPEYDTGFWSRYSLYSHRLFSNLASPYYHSEHITQLQALYLLTGENEFQVYARKWEQYAEKISNVIKVFIIKSFSRMAFNLISK